MSPFFKNAVLLVLWCQMFLTSASPVRLDLPLVNLQSSSSERPPAPKGLQKRALDDTSRFQNMDDFMQRVFLQVSQLPVGDINFPTTSTSARWTIRDYKIGMSYLDGATAIVVASRTGVFLSHYLEDPCFHTTPESPEGPQDLLFEKTVIKTLDEVHFPRYSVVEALKPLIADPGLPESFNSHALFTEGNGVRAAIVSPRRKKSPKKGVDWMYPRYVTKIHDHLRELLPSSASIVEREYTPFSEYENYFEYKKEEIGYFRVSKAFDKLYFQFSPGQGYQLLVGNNSQPVISDFWVPEQAPSFNTSFSTESDIYNTHDTIASLPAFGSQNLDDNTAQRLYGRPKSPVSAPNDGSPPRNATKPKTKIFGFLRRPFGLNLGHNLNRTISSHSQPNGGPNDLPRDFERPSTARNNNNNSTPFSGWDRQGH